MATYKTLSGERPWIWAHRGASGHAPENTMEAFLLALEMGADGVEIDVYFSKDREIVICHDSKIDRTSNGQGTIGEYTLDELKQFDFGCKFYNGERRGIRIPTLEELYKTVAETDLKVNVEVKDECPNICEALLEKARKYGVEDKIYYSCFNHLQLARLLELDPSARVAPLYGQTLLHMDEYAARMGAWAIHPTQKAITTFPSLAEDCHKKGVLVNPWTVNSEEELRRCIEAGADGIITNYPDRAAAILGQ